MNDGIKNNKRQQLIDADTQTPMKMYIAETTTEYL